MRTERKACRALPVNSSNPFLASIGTFFCRAVPEPHESTGHPLEMRAAASTPLIDGAVRAPARRVVRACMKRDALETRSSRTSNSRKKGRHEQDDETRLCTRVGAGVGIRPSTSHAGCSRVITLLRNPQSDRIAFVQAQREVGHAHGQPEHHSCNVFLPAPPFRQCASTAGTRVPFSSWHLLRYLIEISSSSPTYSPRTALVTPCDSRMFNLVDFPPSRAGGSIRDKN